MVTLADLRRYAVGRSLFAPTTLPRAIEKLGFVQADPIRAPARAQDLTLRHRVRNYRAGDLERRYEALPVEEGFFINYGFLPRAHYLLMHPRTSRELTATVKQRAALIAEFVRERRSARQRDIVARFDHGKTTNYWGRQSNATTHLLGIMHYHSMLRVVRREDGARVYEIHDAEAKVMDAVQRRSHVDALVDVVVRAYAPLPGPSLGPLVARLRYAVPQWLGELKPALRRARERFASARVDGVEWYWPSSEHPGRFAARADDVRLLSPFDPIVWDRRRFELFWSWAYRFEAYTPAPKRKLGHYALPMLWRDRIIGWANAIRKREGVVDWQFGYVAGQPREKAFRRALDAELQRMRAFLSQG